MIPGVGRPRGIVLVLCMLLAACTTDNEPQITIIEQETALIDAALARLENTGTANVEYSVWLGLAIGPAWYRYNAAAVRPAASAIKTALAIEFFADRIDALDDPVEKIDAIVNDPDAAAISHFDTEQQQAARQDLPGLTVRQLVEAMLHKKHVNSNAAYNAAANVIIEYLGGGDAGTDLNATVRAAMLLETDTFDDEHYYKGGTLSSVPQVRIEAGWWEQSGQAATYVVIATRDNAGGGEAGFEQLKAELAGLSRLVQSAGIRIRDSQP